MLPLLLLLGGAVAIAASAGAPAKPEGEELSAEGFKLNLPPLPKLSNLPDEHTSEDEYRKLREKYKQVPVIGEGFVRVLDAITDAIGFVVDTSARDLADMKNYDAFAAEVGNQVRALQAQADALAALMLDRYGPERVLPLIAEGDEIVLAESIRTGTAHRLKAHWPTAEGFGEWWSLLWFEPPKLPDVRKIDWRKWQKLAAEKQLHMAGTISAGVLDRFDRMLSELEA